MGEVVFVSMVEVVQWNGQGWLEVKLSMRVLFDAWAYHAFEALSLRRSSKRFKGNIDTLARLQLCPVLEAVIVRI